ncbi:MAG: hypothetical protein R3351_08590, partial [Nitrospirales bacterium]|nr:hypothetical protein [Nitrospirales bacterium]
MLTFLLCFWLPPHTLGQEPREYLTKGALWDRIQVSQNPVFEPADQILINPTQTQWTRYLHALLRLPNWIDLGVAFRVRGEVLTNPFRKGEFGTDDQLPLRTRLRV